MHNQVCTMFDDGLLAKNQDGSFRVVDDPNERIHIQTESKQKAQMQAQEQIIMPQQQQISSQVASQHQSFHSHANSDKADEDAEFDDAEL